MGRGKAAVALLAGQLAWSPPAGSATWIEQAQSDLTCSGLADPSERQSLAAPASRSRSMHGR